MLEERLSAIPFLRELPSPVLTAVASLLTRVDLAAGTTVFTAGDPADALYLVGDGSLVVEEGSTGRELAILGPGAVVGEVGLLLDAPRSATVKVSANAELWRLARVDVEALAASQPQIGVALAREVSRRLLAADRRRVAAPPRVVVVSAAGALQLAQAICADERVGVGVLDLAAVGDQHWPSGVTLLPPSFADPDAIGALASRPADEMSVVVVALPADDTPAAMAAARVADYGVDVGHAVPAWAASELAPLRRLGPPRDDAGLARIARWVSGRAVGLAVSSGGSKAIAHMGVIKALREAGITVDAIAGTSGGAIAAASAAFGLDDDAMAARLHRLAGAFRYHRLIPRVPPRRSLFRGNNVLRLFEEWFGTADLLDARIPLFIVAADVRASTEVVLRAGPVAKAVRASMGIPAVFPPVHWDGRWLTDGGIAAPLPTRTLRDAGLGFIIASNVAGQDPTPPLDAAAPRLTEMLGRVVSTLEREVLGPAVALADVHIRPVVQGNNSFDFRHIEDYIVEGERAAKEALPRLHELVAGG